jgi:outer membrane protein TolC
LAQADAKGAELAQVRLHLATTTSILFDDYFVVSRALEINREHAVLVTHLRQSAEAQYTAGRGSQQDPLQADVALAIIERSRLALAAREQLISAQINGLLHRPASSSLPVAPAEMAAAPAQTEGSSELLARARQVRPELQATSHRVEARRSGVALAERAYYPDFSLAGTYNAMGSQPEDRLMIGLSLDIPIQLGARQGRVEQARAALDLARSRLAERLDAVGVEVRQARVRLEEAFAQVALYREQILPAARRHIAAAEAGYASGRNSFSDIMVAGRQLSTFEEEYAEALASTWRRRAAIERAVGTRAHVLEGGGRP